MPIRTTRPLTFSTFGIRRFQSVGFAPALGIPRLGISPVDLQTALFRSIRGGISFVPNPRAVALIQASPWMIQIMQSRAELVAEHAKSAWHQSGPHPYETGEYVSQIEGSAGLEHGIAVGRVNAYKFTSHWIEFGTSDTPAFAPLRRGAESAGFKVFGDKRSGFFHSLGKIFS